MKMSDDGKIVATVFLSLLIVGLISFFCLSCVVWSVPAGHCVVVSSFGNINGTVLDSGGPYFCYPWQTFYRLNLQTNKNEEHATVPTKNGLTVEVKAVMLYRLDKNKTVELFKTVGLSYEEKLLDPIFRNVVRDVCAEYEPDALYTAERTKVESEVFTKVTKELGERGFIVESVMLQDPKLPQVVTERIQAKVAAEQDAIRMQSVFKQREQEALANKRQKELDAEAKVIEARGIAEAQQIIKKDLDDNYLRYLWIEALKESAKHNNATIYVPTGNDGMPFFHKLK